MAQPTNAPVVKSVAPRDAEPVVLRIVLIALAIGSLFFVQVQMANVARTDPWYRNTDMNIHNMVDALAMNSGLPPNRLDQPGTPTKFLLALDYRILHFADHLPVWNMKKFGASPDPLRQIPPLIQIGRIHSRVFLLAFILSAGWLAYQVTKEIYAPCLTVILFSGCAGLLFHGLLTRTELLCVFAGNILALLCTWQATATRQWAKRHLWLFLAGLLIGLSIFEKLPGVCYVALCYGWCWLAALEDPVPTAGESKRYWWSLLPAAAGVAVLGLLVQLSPHHDMLGPVAL